MTKLGDDLIQSLKEAVAYAKGDGPGREHAPATPHGPDAGPARVEAVGAADGVNRWKAVGPATQR